MVSMLRRGRTLIKVGKSRPDMMAEWIDEALLLMKVGINIAGDHLIPSSMERGTLSPKNENYTMLCHAKAWLAMGRAHCSKHEGDEDGKEATE